MSNVAESTHLGNGVYASDLGYALALSVNDHRNEPVVYLEPEVLEALVKYMERCKQLREVKS